MAEFEKVIGAITVNKNILQVDNQFAGNMFSSDLTYNVNFTDDFWDGFEILEWYAASSVVGETVVCEYDSVNKKLKIPYGAYIKNGPLYVSMRGIKDSVKYSTNILVLVVGENINIEENDIVDDPSWLDKVQAIIDDVFVSKYDPQYEALVRKVNDAIQRANGISETLENKLAGGEFTPEFTIGDVETVEPSVPAEVTQTGTQLDPILNFKIPRGATNVVDSLDGNNVAEAPSVRAVNEGLAKHIELDGSIIAKDKNWNDLEMNKIYLVSGTYQTSLNAPIDTNLTGMLIYMSVPNGASQIVIPRIVSGKVYIRGKSSNAWNDWICVQDYNNLINKPTSMKNPNALTFTGGVTGSYDGSSAKTVNIPTSLPANGGNASTIGDVGIKDIVRKSISGMLTFPVINNDGRSIGLTNGAGNGKIELINNYSSAGDASNLPISQMIAIKQTFIATSTMGMVRFYELWPVRGRVWQNEYNSGSNPQWDGWKLVQGEYTLWTGSAQQEQGVTLSESYKKFGHIEIRSASGIVFEVPTYSESTYDGRVYKGGDSQDFNLYGLQVEFTADKNMYIAKASIRSLINSTTAKFTISRVTGKP